MTIKDIRLKSVLFLVLLLSCMQYSLCTDTLDKIVQLLMVTIVTTFIGCMLQILEQNKMMKDMMNIAHKFQSAYITLSFSFD
jgi:anaerobic C4-dicarboxylate transporter